MQFFFIRHGQSENNFLWDQTRSDEGRNVDPALTEIGQQQAAHLAAFLAAPGVQGGNSVAGYHSVTGFGLTHLYCSPMLRAVQTAMPIAQALDLTAVVWGDIFETGGIYRDDPETGKPIGLAGRSRAEFAAEFPDLVLPETGWEDGWWNRPFEEREERPPRARRVLKTLLEWHGGTEDRVAIVSHGGFFNHLMRVILDLPEDTPAWLEMQNTAMTRIDFHTDYLRMIYTNRVDFLPRALLT